jgi:hypothetical protein
MLELKLKLQADWVGVEVRDEDGDEDARVQLDATMNERSEQNQS